MNVRDQMCRLRDMSADQVFFFFLGFVCSVFFYYFIFIVSWYCYSTLYSKLVRPGYVFYDRANSANAKEKEAEKEVEYKKKETEKQKRNKKNDRKIKKRKKIWVRPIRKCSKYVDKNEKRSLVVSRTLCKKCRSPVTAYSYVCRRHCVPIYYSKRFVIF